jgi:hypothetical protein
LSSGMAAVPAQAGDVSTVISPLLTGYSTTHACARRGIQDAPGCHHKSDTLPTLVANQVSDSLCQRGGRADRRLIALEASILLTIRREKEARTGRMNIDPTCRLAAKGFGKTSG